MYGSSRRKRREEYKNMVKDKAERSRVEILYANELWQQMKNIMMETAQVTCGLSKDSCINKETWWWNEEVAEAVREKKKSMEFGKKWLMHGRSTKCNEGYFLSRVKETEGMCK